MTLAGTKRPATQKPRLTWFCCRPFAFSARSPRKKPQARCSLLGGISALICAPVTGCATVPVRLAIPFNRSASTLAIAILPGTIAANVAGEITAVVGGPDALPPKFSVCPPGRPGGAGAAWGSDASEPTEVEVMLSDAENSVFVELLLTVTASGPWALIA